MRYYQGRSADVWNSAVSVHGKKASNPHAVLEHAVLEPETDEAATEPREDAQPAQPAT
jgi:hypothetical protein